MSKAWRVMIIVVLLALVVGAVALKSRQDKGTEPASTHTAVKMDTDTATEPEQVKPSPEPTELGQPGEATEPAKPASTAKPAVTKTLPKLIDVGSDECVPCRMMAPILDQLKEDYKGRLEVVFVNKKTEPEKAEKLGVRLIPTQILYDDKGKEFFRHTGFYPKDEILARFREHGVKL